METFLIRALQLIMSLSLLVIIHEGGHFLFARLFKVRVEKFCLFFDPWFTLFKFKPKRSDTEYAVGWLPLGGYVKIAGMIDESMDTEQMKQPEQPWEFRSKPAWQRLLIMVGGTDRRDLSGNSHCLAVSARFSIQDSRLPDRGGGKQCAGCLP